MEVTYLSISSGIHWSIVYKEAKYYLTATLPELQLLHPHPTIWRSIDSLREDQAPVEDHSRWNTVTLQALFKQEPGYQNNSWCSEGVGPFIR